MGHEESNAGFGATHWTLIGKLQSGDQRERRAAMEAIARQYRSPVYACFRKMGHQPDVAHDLTQEFFTHVVLGGGLLDIANRDKGRLRSLIRKAAQNFNISAYRRNSARPDGLSLQALEREEAFLAEANSAGPDDAFDRSWALTVLQHALERCEQSYQAKGKDRNWEVFESHTLLPLLGQCQAVPLEQLATQLGFRDAAHAAQAVQTVKRRLLTLLKEITAETCGDEREAEEEFRDVLTLLRWRN